MDVASPEPGATCSVIHGSPKQNVVHGSPGEQRTTPEALADGVAIVGIGAITPGAENIRELWTLLQNGENHITDVPASRWNADAFYDSDPMKPGKSYSKKAGFVKDVDMFDNAFFEISDYEAASLDPQQSLILECTHMALEDGGFTRSHMAGTNTAVFIGAMTSDHASFYPAGSPEVDSYTATGINNSMLAGRVSFVYNLLGPSMVIDTACSSSLVAIHQGIQAIRNGDCDMAICGGVNYIGTPDMFVQLSKAKMLSPTGQSKSFSASADGYTRGEGCGIVILKRLKDALDNNDRVWATVVSGVNQDGHTVTPVTAPSGAQQEKLMRDIYTKYDIDVSRLDYIEAHGTGTQAGDPVEVNAIGNVLKERSQHRTRYIGSVKTNIGHLEAASGIIAVIKVLLMMKHGLIVPSLHCQKINPLIDLENLGLAVPQSLVKWESEGKMACCTAFGLAGTNSHVILREMTQTQCPTSETRHTNVVCFSGKTKQSLIRSMEMIKEMENTGASKAENSKERLLAGVAYTSCVRRDHCPLRMAFVVERMQDLFDSVSHSLAEDLPLEPARRRHVVFVFCGMGTARPGMCLQMMETFPVFKETIIKIDAILSEINKNDNWLLIDCLSKDDLSKDPLLSPIAIFACQVALVALWKSLGVSPDCVVGQSIGEIAAAYTAGCLSLEAAVSVIYYRSKVLAQVTGGKMIVVKNIRVERVREILQEFDNASIALEYSPLSCAVSADSDTMSAVQQRLQSRLNSGEQVQLIPLNVPVAYHSQFVESCKEQLASALDKLEAKPPETSYISAVTGEKMTNAPGQGYWVSHLREPVLFHKAVQNARKESPTDTVFIEIGPRPVLKVHMADIFPTEDVPLIESMHKHPEERTFLHATASLYELGVDLTWSALYKGYYDIADTPRYVFDKKKSLKPTAIRAVTLSGTKEINPHLYLFPISSTNTFKIFLSTLKTSFVYDHIVSNVVIVPGALYVEAGMAIANHLRYDPAYQPVVSATFISPVPSRKDEFVELDVRSDKGAQTVDCQQLRVSVHNHDRRISNLHIHWQPVRHRAQRIINLQRVKNKCTVPLDKNDIYVSLRGLGFQYGRTFSLLEKAYQGERECLAQIKIISEVWKDFVSTTIHPCVLDAMFQSTIIMHDVKVSGDLQLLPGSVTGLKVFGAMETVMYVYSRFLRDDGKRASYKLTLLSTNGLVLATVEEFVLIRIHAEDPCGLPMLLDMRWTRAFKTWGADTRISEDAFIIHTGGNSEASEVNNVKYHTDHARDWDEIHQEVRTLMQEARHPPAIVVVCHTEVTKEMTCDVLENLVLNTCGVIHSVLRHARDLNFVMPVYICTFKAWAEVEASFERIQVSPAATAVWGMMRTAQSENVYPRLVTIDLHVPAKHVTSEFLSLMAQILSSSHNNSEFCITAEAVYINRVSRVDKHTRVPLLRETPLDPNEDCLIVTDDTDILAQPFAVKFSTSEDLNGSNVIIKPFLFALPSPYLITAAMTCNKTVGGFKQYPVLALETVGQSSHENGEVTVACCVIQGGSRVSVPKETTLPASVIPDYRVGDLTKLVLLFALSEKVSTPDVTILTSTTHVGLAHAMKIKLETDSRTRQVLVEESRNFSTLIIPSQTVVSLILIDSDVISMLTTQWPSAKRLVTCASLITPEALTHLACVCPEVDIKTIDTQLLFRPLKLKQIVPEVKSWLEKQDKKNSSVSEYLHSFEKADAVNSEFCDDTFSRMLSFTELDLNNMFLKVDAQNMFSANSVYIVVGGLTGLGWICVKFLARHGARNIAIIQRRTPSAVHCSNIEEISSHFHCSIQVFQADVTSLHSTEKALYSIGKSFGKAVLKGIFFGAAVLDDGPFSSMNRDKFDKALAPKVKGAWNFHLLTKHLLLDFFVMHSSISSVFGNQGEANYSAGNSFLDGLAYYRRYLGLCAQSFSWGSLAAGLLENNKKAQLKLESWGLPLMTEAEIDNSLSPLLMLNWPHCIPTKVDQQRFTARLQFSETRHLLHRFPSLGSPDVKMSTFDRLEDVATAKTKDPVSRLEVYRSYIRTLASKVLAVDQSLLTLDTNLMNFGMDSVSSMMMIDQIYRDTNIRLNTFTLISGEATVGIVAQALNDATDSQS